MSPKEPCWEESGDTPEVSKGWVDWLKDRPHAVCAVGKEFIGQAWDDYKNFYTCANLIDLALGIAVAAPLANTSADRAVRDWYQQDVRTPDLDDCAAFAKRFGDHMVMIPIYLGAACVGRLTENTTAGSTLHQWANRTCRAMLVGAPTVGILQVGLGASRPEEMHSNWRPFQDSNGVAGHGFIGAVPFLAAASMTENPLCRYSLIAASFATNWSRINDDSHYLSQTVLGWWIAYLAVRSVDATEQQRRHLSIFPCPTENGAGVGVFLEY